MADGPGGFKVNDHLGGIDAKKNAQKVLLQPFAFGNSLHISGPRERYLGLDMPTPGSDGLRSAAVDSQHGREALGWLPLRLRDGFHRGRPHRGGHATPSSIVTYPEQLPRNGAVTFNPGGALNGARFVKVAGSYAYVALGHNGLQVVDISDPTHPKTGRPALAAPDLVDARSCADPVPLCLRG